MKLVFEPFIKTANTGAPWLGLFPCHENDPLYTTGVYTIEEDYSMQDFGLDYIIVPVWDKAHDWEYFIDDIKEYLIVDMKVLGPGKYHKYSLEAKVIRKVPKTEITIHQAEDYYELNLDAVGTFRYKKM